MSKTASIIRYIERQNSIDKIIAKLQAEGFELNDGDEVSDWREYSRSNGHEFTSTSGIVYSQPDTVTIRYYNYLHPVHRGAHINLECRIFYYDGQKDSYRERTIYDWKN